MKNCFEKEAGENFLERVKIRIKNIISERKKMNNRMKKTKNG